MLETGKRSVIHRAPPEPNKKLVCLRVNERLINTLGFIVALFLLSRLQGVECRPMLIDDTDLFLESQPLLEGVIEFCVGIAKLLSTHEALEAFAEPRT
jgi:hypothetical protein